MATPKINTNYVTNLPWLGSKYGHNEFHINFLEDGEAFDLTGRVFSLAISTSEGATAKLTLTEGQGLTKDAEAGTLVIVLTESQALTTLKGTDYFYLLTYTYDSKTYGLYAGKLTLSRGKNLGNITTTVNAAVTMAGEDGSFTSITANVTLAGGSGSAEESTFTSNPTLVLPSGFTLGKYGNGDTPNWTGLTAIEALLDAITDYINPAFSAFSVSGQSTTVEVGTTLSGSKTFTWTLVVNSGTISGINIYDNTAAANLVTGTANDGSQAATITTNQLNSNGETQSWKAVAIDSANDDNEISSNNFTVTARYYRFFGPAASSPANSAAVRALASSAFQTGTGNFNLETGTTQTKFVVALPPGFVISAVIDLDALNADITSEYELIGTIEVQDAGGTARTYNLYEMNAGAPYGASHTHQITISAA